MRLGFRTVAVVVMVSLAATALLPGSLEHSRAQTSARYLPEYTPTGELILPKNFHEWVVVGSPLTPNAPNGGNAIFQNITTSIYGNAIERAKGVTNG